MIKERVDAGVKWLDETHPEWREKINVDILDMFDNSKCILGQMFTSYAHASSVLGKKFCLDHGFSIDNITNYYELTQEWRGRLQKVYDLSKEKVPVGRYKVVELTTSHQLKEDLWVSREVTVVDYQYGDHLTNYVIGDSLTLYENPFIKVLKVYND